MSPYEEREGAVNHIKKVILPKEVIPQMINPGDTLNKRITAKFW